jgi:hypothetical protein
MAELFGEPEVAIVMMFFAFGGTLGAVGIVGRDFSHGECSSREKLLTWAACRRDSQFAQPLAGLQRFVGFGIALDYVAKFRDAVGLLA